MSLPTAAFDATKSIYAGKSVIQLKIGASTVVFESTKLSHKDNREFKMIERPDANGVLRVVRKVCTKGAEVFTYQLDEAKRLVDDLFSGALSGIVTATATIWEPDPSDASGTVALKSEDDFACDITRPDDLNFGEDFTKVGIAISSHKAGDVTFTTDADTTS